jgi:light-harvesting complex I chlorophyll a/b binding protein 1
LKFDPLGLKPKLATDFKTIQTKELNNGRLAMLGVAGIVAQELVTGQSIF